MRHKLDLTLLCVVAVLFLLLSTSVTTAQLPTEAPARVFLPLVAAFSSTQQQSDNLNSVQDSVDEFQGNDSTEPIAFLGHGAMFDHDGKEIEVTLEFIEAAQIYYLSALYKQATDNQRARLKEKRNKLFHGQQWDKQSELVANSALLDWLINEIDLTDAGVLLGKNNLMRQLLRSKPVQAQQSRLGYGGESFSLPQELTDRLAAAGLAGASVQASAQLDSADYIQQCAANGVPIPPAWWTSGWVSKGTLSDAEEFISTDLEAEVYVYDSTSPEGLCFALPRSAGNSIELLGIICLGKASSNACFWDNQENDQQKSIPKGGVKPLAEFAGGPELFGGSGGRCTGCHVGENPFVIHPNTNLGLPKLNGLDLFANNWYQPLVHPDWPQNTGPTNVLDNVLSTGKCTTCHTQTGGGGRFPELSTEFEDQEYCDVILPQASARTMPPGNPGDSSYTPHVNALLAACNNPSGPPPCNGTIYVDAAYTGSGSGSKARPFRTVGAAYNYACAGATLNIKTGSYPETLDMSKNVTLISEDGIATIGP